MEEISNSNNLIVQNQTEYQLTEKEKALLEVLLNPEYRTKSITDVCKIANCTRSTYYEAFSKPGFKAIYEERTKELIKQSIGPVVNSFVREAIRGSFQHGKVILEMAGLYSEKSTLEVTGEVTLAADDRRARIAELLSKKQLDSAILVDYSIIDSLSHKATDKQDTEKDGE
jgi:hypothetical protein